MDQLPIPVSHSDGMHLSSAIVFEIKPQSSLIESTKNQTQAEVGGQILDEIHLVQVAVKTFLDVIFLESTASDRELKNAAAVFEEFINTREKAAKVKQIMTDQSKVIRAVMLQSVLVYFKNLIGQKHVEEELLLHRIEATESPLLMQLLKEANVKL